MNGAWKVGLLVIIAGAMIVGAFAILGRSLWAAKNDLYFAELPDAGGVTAGTRILMSGVQVGTVRKVELASAKVAKLTLAVQATTKLPVGTEVRIPSSFIGIGDTPIELEPGQGPGELTEGATLFGKKTSALETMMPEAQTTLVELNKTLKETQVLMQDIQAVAKDREITDGVKKLMATTENTVSQYGRLAGRLDGVIASNQGKVTEALSTATLAMKDVQQSTRMISKLIQDGKLTGQVDALMVSLNNTTEKAGKLVDSLQAAIEDPEMRGSIEKTTKNVETLTESGVRMSADVEKMAKNGVTITENTAELTKKANEIADEAKSLTEKLNKLVGKADGAIGGMGAPKIKAEVGLDLYRDFKPNRYRTDIEAKLTFNETPLYLGLFDAFESNKITIQTGMPFDQKRGNFRYGIYASKPGIGVEYEIARGLMFRGDLFDINNPRGDVRARFDMGSGFYGWLGVNQVFKRNSFMVGVGFRK